MPLQNSVKAKENFAEEDEEDKVQEATLRRRTRDDDYGVSQAITNGIRLMVKVLSFCIAIGVLLVFSFGCWLVLVHVFHVVKSPEQTAALLGRALEWASVLFTGLFFDRLWRHRNRA